MLRLSSAALRLIVTSALLLGLAAAPRMASAAPMQVVLRIVAGEDDELLSRVQGQTVDLDVRLEVVRDERLETTIEAQIEASVELAGERNARVVVWFRHTAGGGVVVHVAEPGAATALIRELDPPATAAAEAAALVVRSALRALAAGGRIGVDTTSLVGNREPSPEPDVVAARAKPTANAEPVRTRWWAGVGWQAVVDGESPTGQQGLAVDVGAARGRWRAGIAVSASLPASLDDELTVVDLSRDAAGISIGYDLVRRDRVQLEVGVAGGVAGYFRSTVTLSPAVNATPSTVTAAGFASPQARLRWQVAASHERAWLQLGVAADVVFGAPELGYELDGAFVVRNQLWPLQPRFLVAFVVETQ